MKFSAKIGLAMIEVVVLLVFLFFLAVDCDDDAVALTKVISDSEMDISSPLITSKDDL
jgi:hypothetical protein